MSTTAKQTNKTTQRKRRVFPARVKCEAVLSIWAERRKPSEVCRELGIKWASLSHWQDRALEAMMSALEPRTSQEEDRGPALGPKLEKLLEKATKRSRQMSKLERRLEKIQQETPTAKTASERKPSSS